MKLLKTVAVVVVLGLAYPTWLGVQIWQQSRQDEVKGADAIVVLGAAQYDGRPSPIFQARLDQAAYLYGEDLSDNIIVTGGKAPGDRFTESEAGARYLVEQGIPEDVLLAEDEGRTTLQSLENVQAIATETGLNSLLLVSDPMHSERIKRIAADLGFDPAYASPASYTELNRSRSTKAKELFHEIGSILAYEIFDR
ncbi:MAG: YdcF family protein [Actinobacteria bacterium]|nr:YdcF family protein [Actinomycetota bacterium]